MEPEALALTLPIRRLVEFLLRTGSIDSRFTGFDRANEGARIHRKLQKAAGEGYQAEVFLSAEREACGIDFTLEGRADGIFTDENGTVTIDEIKTTTVPYEEITEELNPCHWAQGMVYAAIFSSQQGLGALAVRLTYYQVDTDRGRSGSWTGTSGAARALRRCNSPLRSTAPGSGRWRARCTAPAALEKAPTARAAPAFFVRHPPASVRP